MRAVAWAMRRAGLRNVQELQIAVRGRVPATAAQLKPLAVRAAV
jgi:hypothetical protein